MEMIPVFSEWLIKRYALHEKTMMMLAENRVSYSDLKVPCAPEVIKNHLAPLERIIQTAFESGYDSVKQLPRLPLFQWMAKLMYGVLYNDMVHGIEQMKKKNESFKISPLLAKKFGNLHSMLQSVIQPMEFEKFQPWSIEIFKVNYSTDLFNYKDETKNINFSLGMNGFGVVACLQDNGENEIFHKDLLDKIGDHILHPIQFEEVCARYLYSNYLLNTSKIYQFEESEQGVKVTLETDPSTKGKPLFNKWEDKTYSQVLANYWKPWGLTTKDIYSFPNSPISYLVNEYTNEFIDPATISHQH